MTVWHVGFIQVNSREQLVSCNLSVYEGDNDFAKDKLMNVALGAAEMAAGAGDMVSTLGIISSLGELSELDFSAGDWKTTILAHEVAPATMLIMGDADFLNEKMIREKFMEANDSRLSKARLEWKLTDHRECQKLDHCIHRSVDADTE